MHFIHLETGKEAGVCVCGGEEVGGVGGKQRLREEERLREEM